MAAILLRLFLFKKTSFFNINTEFLKVPFVEIYELKYFLNTSSLIKF